jgi:ATP-binding cassette subfamily B protein
MVNQNRSVNRATIRIFWKAILENKKYLWLSLLYPIGAIMLSTAAPLFVGKILAALAHPNQKITDYLVYFAISGIIGIIGNRYGFAALMTFQAKAMASLQTKAFTTLLRRSVGFHNNNIAGRLVSDAVDFPQAFSLISNAVIINIFPLLMTLVIGLIIVFAASLYLGLIVAAMACYAVGSGAYESHKRQPLRIRRLAATKAVTGHLADSIVNAPTVKTFAREKTEIETHKKLNKVVEEIRISDWQLGAYTGNNRIIILFALQFAYIIILTSLVHSQPSLLAIGIFAFSFTITLSNRLFEINALVRNIEEGLLQASPMTEFILQEPEIQDIAGAKKLKVSDGRIIFKSVDFKYAESDHELAVFKNLKLDISPGEKVGLAGPSGGGKSTLTRLLLRFEDVIGGAIEIDGQNISEVTQASLREAIAYVPQEPLLFHRPISENIAYGKPGIGISDIKKAAKAANAADFIERLPNGYDTIVGERGVKLSGGQRQRVAIARAMLKQAPILVLDEATSALDSESEKLIQDALWKLMEGRTAIVIAHRLSTIQRMDRIIVLDEGKIIEEGSHKELLAEKGTYARLWAHQSGGFLKE